MLFHGTDNQILTKMSLCSRYLLLWRKCNHKSSCNWDWSLQCAADTTPHSWIVVQCSLVSRVYSLVIPAALFGHLVTNFWGITRQLFSDNSYTRPWLILTLLRCRLIMWDIFMSSVVSICLMTDLSIPVACLPSFYPFIIFCSLQKYGIFHAHILLSSLFLLQCRFLTQGTRICITIALEPAW